MLASSKLVAGSARTARALSAGAAASFPGPPRQRPASLDGPDASRLVPAVSRLKHAGMTGVAALPAGAAAQATQRPSVIVFDVNETLSDLAPMAQSFMRVGASGEQAPLLAKLWFAAVLRDAFALTAAGGFAKFSVLAEAALRALLPNIALKRSLDDAVSDIMAAFTSLQLHPDASDMIRALKSDGLRLVTLSNGAASVAAALIERSGVRSAFSDDDLLSVEGAGTWKPARGAYEYAARACGVPIEDMLLVAVHPWDIHGAASAGMMTAWVSRGQGGFPDHFQPPTVTVSSLADLPNAVADLRKGTRS